MKAEVAIVGNGVAGYACAARLARHGIRPLLIGPGLPVDRPPLTKQGLAAGAPVLLADEARLDQLGIDRLDAHVGEAHLATGRLVAGETEIEADRIVLATGLTYRPPRIPGLEAAHVNATPRGMTRLVEALAGEPKRVVVVGAGLIGTETGATLAVAGHDVTAIDVLDRPLDRLHDPLPALGAPPSPRRACASSAAPSSPSSWPWARTGKQQSVTREARSPRTSSSQRPAVVRSLPPGLDVEATELPLRVGPDLRVPGLERVHAVGDLILAPHARFGPIRFPHWDMAIATGDRAADAIAGVESELDRLPYWWSDIGPRTFAEVGWAEAAMEWGEEDGLHVGRDATGEPVAVLVVDDPRKLRAGRALLGA